MSYITARIGSEHILETHCVSSVGYEGSCSQTEVVLKLGHLLANSRDLMP